jgi:hypothetical protein
MALTFIVLFTAVGVSTGLWLADSMPGAVPLVLLGAIKALVVWELFKPPPRTESRFPDGR